MAAKEPKRGSLETISLEGKLTESGLKASARSRALTAIDRLIGTVADWGAALAEKKVRQTDLRTEYEEKLLRIRADDALEQEKQILLENAIKRERRSRDNLIGITQKTIEHLGEHVRDSDESDASVDLPEDWLNLFASYAEMASSERLQDMWARILAGEVRKPGAFCLPTLRFVAELDQVVAKTFENALENLFQNSLPRPDSIEGDQLARLLLLQEVGLITNVSGGGLVHIAPKPAKDGFRYYSAFPGEIRTGQLLLRVKVDAPPEIEIMALTRVGREISSILPRPPERRVLDFLAERYRESAESMEIVEIVETEKMSFKKIEEIK